MNKDANPIEYVIEFAWASGADRFVINNAKDELQKLVDKSKEMAIEAFKANQFAIEETNRWLSCEKELAQIKSVVDTPVAWARINSLGDLFDLRLQNNPHIDQKTIVPLYRKKS